MTLMCGEKWLETGNPFTEGNMSESKEAWLIAENERSTKENEQLVRDMHRIDSAKEFNEYAEKHNLLTDSAFDGKVDGLDAAVIVL